MIILLVCSFTFILFDIFQSQINVLIIYEIAGTIAFCVVKTYLWGSGINSCVVSTTYIIVSGDSIFFIDSYRCIGPGFRGLYYAGTNTGHGFSALYQGYFCAINRSYLYQQRSKCTRLRFTDQCIRR